MADELVRIETSSTAIANAVTSSSWGDEEDEIRPRYLQLKNPKSVVLEDYKNGHFVDKAIGRSWEVMQLVLLGVRLSRKLQTPYKEGEKRELLCRSANRKQPVTTDDRFTPKAADCYSCSFGQQAWARYKQTGNKEDLPKNPCELEVELLFIEKANPKQPYIYIISGKGRDAAEAMYKMLKDRSKDVADRTGRRPELYEYVVTMTSERNSSGNYQPKFTQIAELTQEQAEAEFGEAYRTFVLARRQAFEAAKEAAAAHAALESSREAQEETRVIETPAQPAVKPQYIPPASKRQVGTRPVYVAPVAAPEVTADDGTKVSI